MGPTTARVGLGSNEGDRRATLAAAVEALGALPDTRVAAVSSLYRTRPWGDPDQPDFLNAVATLDTGLEPASLLDGLLAAETALGRRRDPARRWGPRRIDLDLLLMDGVRMNTARLTLPHPHLHERAFVLVPLAELEVGLEIPGRGSLADLLAAVDNGGVTRVAGPGWERE